MAIRLTREDYARRLRSAPLFKGLGAELLLAIAGHATLRALRRGQVLWKQGQHAYELAFVWEGQLDVVRTSEGPLTFRSVRADEIIGLSNAMGLTPCTVDVVAGQPSRVLLLPGELLRSLVPKYPELAFRALDHMGALLGRLSDEVEVLHRASLEDRVARRLRTLAAGRREIVITHEELARQVAARRESVSRVLSMFKKRGILRCRRGRIELLDPRHAR